MFRLKVLDRYLLKSFLKPFFATFFIILFILVMQAVWKAFESFAGKGITAIIILKFLWYTLLVIASQAIPIGVLLSSIMCLGNFSEKYEYAAAKSAGISLKRILKPLAIVVLIISFINFLCLNYVYPYAMLKQINLRVNIKQKEPSLALVAGSFNTEIPNFQIKFEKKYGKNNSLLKNVVIYDLSERIGNNKIITAKQGKIISEKASRYMTLKLNDGHFFEHHKVESSDKEREMPASFASFDEYVINIDVSKFMNDNLEEERYTRNYNMLSLKQLKDTIGIIKKEYDDFIISHANNFALDLEIDKLKPKKDSIAEDNTKIKDSISKDSISNINTLIKDSITKENIKIKDSITEDNAKIKDSITKDNIKIKDSKAKINTKTKDSITKADSKIKNIIAKIDTQTKQSIDKDSTKKEIKLRIIDNFEIASQLRIIKTASNKIDRDMKNDTQTNRRRFKWQRKKMNLYDIEFYNRIALSLGCLLLFFIGAPLGSIIKKGGMGLPMVMAVLIYVTYFFTNTLGKNMAEENSLTTFMGSWIATFIMTPLAIIFTIRATQDKSLGNFGGVITKVTTTLTSFIKKKISRNNNEK